MKKGIIMAAFRSLTGEQLRQVINLEQTYEAFRSAQAERDQRFRGSMSWKQVGGHQYLYRKISDRWMSLGPRSTETEHSFAQFHEGRAAVRARIKDLDQRIRTMAPINRAMRLGRVPWDAARVMRRVERSSVLRDSLSVVGTHALFAYERLAGGQFDRAAVATDDIDLLFDHRRRLRLVTTANEGLMGALRAADPTFTPVARGSYRAVNAKGFMVDLIQPMPRFPSSAATQTRITEKDELTAAEIEGLAWLQNCPQITQIVIDERGYPLRMKVPDPRAFALHKLWVSEQPSRDRVKALRDKGQAIAVAGLVLRYLPALRFDDESLKALPSTLRDRASELLELARIDDLSDTRDWF